jgi:uncharacterized protein (DUF697 family)
MQMIGSWNQPTPPEAKEVIVSGQDSGHVLRVAGELCKALNKHIDDTLPEKIATIVKTHAGLAVASALVPIPGADVAAAGANIWTMYLRINKELELSFAEAALKTIAVGVATNLGAYAAGTVILGSLIKIIPGIGTVGGTVLMGATIYSVTLVSSIVYMTALTKLLKSKSTTSFTANDLKCATDEALKDKATLKAALNEAKSQYRAQKESTTEEEGNIPSVRKTKAEEATL